MPRIPRSKHILLKAILISGLLLSAIFMSYTSFVIALYAMNEIPGFITGIISGLLLISIVIFDTWAFIMAFRIARISQSEED